MLCSLLNTTSPFRLHGFMRCIEKMATCIHQHGIHSRDKLAKVVGPPSEEDKQSITTHLRCILNKIRSLESLGFYASTTEGPLPHRYFFARDHNQTTTGPFKQEQELSFALAERSRLNWAENNRHGWPFLFLRWLTDNGNYPSYHVRFIPLFHIQKVNIRTQKSSILK